VNLKEHKRFEYQKEQQIQSRRSSNFLVPIKKVIFQIMFQLIQMKNFILLLTKKIYHIWARDNSIHNHYYCHLNTIIY